MSCAFFSFGKGAELSAACGRKSEAEHGKANEKTSDSELFDYGLPMVRRRRPKKRNLRGSIAFHRQETIT